MRKHELNAVFGECIRLPGRCQSAAQKKKVRGRGSCLTGSYEQGTEGCYA